MQKIVLFIRNGIFDGNFGIKPESDLILEIKLHPIIKYKTKKSLIKNKQSIPTKNK